MQNSYEAFALRFTVPESLVPKDLATYTAWLDKAKGPALKFAPGQGPKSGRPIETRPIHGLDLSKMLPQIEATHRMVLAWIESKAVGEKTYIVLVYLFVRRDVALTSEKTFNFNAKAIREELVRLLADHSWSMRRLDDNAVIEDGREVVERRRLDYNFNMPIPKVEGRDYEVVVVPTSTAAA